jgi:hypothetical protein
MSPQRTRRPLVALRVSISAALAKPGLARRSQSEGRLGNPLRVSISVLGIALVSIATAGRASAGRNDLKLINLCPQTSALGVQECRWVQRDAKGLVTGVAIDSEGRSNFRSLMSELGVVMAPRIPMPADTIGFAGFQVSGELGLTEISNNKSFWNGVNAVSPQAPTSSRPDGMLTTLGVFLHKGIWFPAPSFEVGGGVVNLLDSQMLSWQGYAKLALHEGFHDLPFPSLAIRAAFAYLTGTDQVSLKTTMLDVLVSKGFGVLKTVRIEPFGGWSLLMIKAAGKTIDFTPLCDSQEVAQATPGQQVSGCALAQSGSPDDLKANAAFPSQDIITRHRVFGGAKLKFGILAVVAQYELYLKGYSRDEDVISAVDQSGLQNSFSLSTGLQF